MQTPARSCYVQWALWMLSSAMGFFVRFWRVASVSMVYLGTCTGPPQPIIHQMQPSPINKSFVYLQKLASLDSKFSIIRNSHWGEPHGFQVSIFSTVVGFCTTPMDPKFYLSFAALFFSHPYALTPDPSHSCPHLPHKIFYFPFSG